jgi:hypothetical protein
VSVCPLPGATIKTTSSILKTLAESEKEQLSFGEVIDATRSRAHGFGLLLFALPETIPLPVPSASIFLAIPIVLIAAHLAAFGEGPGLPQRLLRQTIPVSVIQKVSKYVGPVLEKIPLGNLGPAMGIAVIALGMMQRDGVLILIGVGLALFLGVGLYFAADALAGMFGG